MIKKQTSRIWPFLRASIALVLVGWGSWTLYQSITASDAPQPPQQQKTVTAGVPTKRTEEEKAAYAVSAEHPRLLTIPSLHLSANILPMGLTKENAIEAPASAWDVGWYGRSALPGSEYGSMIIDGHVNDTLNKPGIFYALNRLRIGDTIIVEKGDLQRLEYHVTGVEWQPRNNVDIDNLLKSPVKGSEGLRLITCGGQYDSDHQTYDERVVVTAIRT